MILYNKEYNEKIRRICEENPISYSNVFRGKENSYLFSYILSCTEDAMPITTPTKLAKRINFVLHEFQSFPKCKNPECDNVVKGIDSLRWNDTWTEHCCNKCAQRDPEIKKIVKLRKKEKYGDENYCGNIEEIKRRNREKYGTDWFFSSDEGKRKVKETWLKNGYDHPMHCKRIRDEMSERYMDRHGVPYSCLNPEVMKKSKLPYFYNGIYFKSSWELAYYIFLSDKGTKFEYQPSEHFKYTDDKGKTRYYFPDFKVEDKFVEIKGTQFIKENGDYRNPYDIGHETDGLYEAKHRCMLENDIRILLKDDLKDVFGYCITKFNGDRNWHLNFKVKERPNISISDIKDLNIDFDVGNITKEFEYFRNKTVSEDIPKGCQRNSIVKYFQQDVFYKKEKDLWKNDENIRNRLIENRCRFLKKKEEELTVNDILLGFKYSGLNYGYSHFNPLWFKWFIRKYDIKTCYDPCGGWGHRLLGGLGLERYIYNDYSTSTKNNVDEMIRFFSIKNTVTYNEDCRKFVPKEDFESMFTCVPYYNLEHYECGDFENMDEYGKFLDSIFETFHKTEKCRIFGLVIREDMLSERHCDYDEKFLLSRKCSVHLTGKRQRKSAEYLYVFRK